MKSKPKRTQPKAAPGYAAILYDINNISVNLVKIAIRRGVDITAKRPDGITLMMLAAAANDTKLMTYLKLHGVSLHALDYEGSNATIYAGRMHARQSIALLEEWKCDFQARNIHGCSGQMYRSFLI